VIVFLYIFFNAIYSTGDASLIPQRTPKTKSHSRVIRQKKGRTGLKFWL